MMQLASVLFVGRIEGVSNHSLSLAIAAFSVGLYVLGPLSSFLVVRFQRKNVYEASLLVLVAISGIMYFCRDVLSVALVRFLEGAVCGLAQVSLGSTLLNDLTSSERRTVSDYYFAWSAILAVPAGVAASYYIMPLTDFHTVLLVSVSVLLLSAIVIVRIRVPFRAPIHVSLFSCDRFWQKK